MSSYNFIYQQFIEAEEERKRRNLHQNFCAVPFSSLFINFDGTVSGCRQKGTDFIVGDLKTQSLEEIWNSDFMQNWRREFLTGNVLICNEEVTCRQCHRSTTIADASILSAISTDIMQKTPILRLGLSPSNLCNASCIMCTDRCNNHSVYTPNLSKQEVSGVLEIELFSGEPLIQPEVFKLFDIFRHHSPNIRWIIYSNLNWVFTDTLKAQLDQIDIKHLIVSFDTCRSHTLDTIRPGISLEQVKSTLDQLLAYSASREERGLNGLGIYANNLFQRTNILEVEEVLNYMESKNIPSFRSLVYRPEELSVLSLPINDITANLDYFFAHFSKTTLSRSQNIILPMIHRLPGNLKKRYICQYLSLTAST